MSHLKLGRLIGITLILSGTSYSPTLMAQPQMSGINQLSFHDAKYNKAFVGNGFLIRHKGQVYAVTVKHVLLEAKTPELKNVDIKGHVKEWRLHSNLSPDNYLLLGELINNDPQEAIDMKILQKDWLVFKVLENHSNLEVLNLRQSPLKTGETLSAFGCSYANKTSCTQDVYTGEFLANAGNNLRIKMPDLDLSKLRGLSGSPVVDAKQQVVGIVSNVLPSQSGTGFDFAPASLTYLKQILSTID